MNLSRGFTTSDPEETYNYNYDDDNICVVATP